MSAEAWALAQPWMTGLLGLCFALGVAEMGVAYLVRARRDVSDER